MDNNFYNKYVILIIAICLLYYFVYKYKGDRSSRFLAIFIIAGATFSSIVRILADTFFELSETINNFFIVPIGLWIIVLFYLLTINAWKIRKDPEKRIGAYVWFGTLIFMVLFLIVVLTLIQTGFYD